MLAIIGKKQDYLRIAPTTGTADNLNQTGIISYEENQENYLYLPESLPERTVNSKYQAKLEPQHLWPYAKISLVA